MQTVLAFLASILKIVDGQVFGVRVAKTAEYALCLISILLKFVLSKYLLSIIIERKGKDR